MSAPDPEQIRVSPLLRAAYEARAKREILDDKEDSEKSLVHFLQSGWQAFKPESEYVHNWHISAVCEKLEAVSNGEIHRLQVWVPPGTSKPIDEEALILRGDGQRIPLREIVAGDYVITHTGRQARVDAVHEQGVLPTLRIETDCGRIVHAAIDHPFLTPAGWVRADELEIGTTLANVSVPEVDGNQIHKPEEMRLIGYFVGDGNCTYGKLNDNSRNTLAARITCMDPTQGEDIITCAEALGFKASYSKAKTGARTINLSNGVRSWLEAIGLAGHGSWTKRVPSFVFSASNDLIANFIGAYFACDGTLTKRSQERRDLGISFSSVNRVLLEDMQHLLLRLGIQSRVRSHRQGGFKGENYLSWRLTITSYDETAKFIARVPVMGVKADRLAVWSSKRGRFDEVLAPDKIVSIESGGLRRCRCLTIATDHSFTAADVVVKNTATVSVFWPAWEWTTRPWLRYWGASYETRFAGRIAALSRDLMRSEWYQARWSDQFSFDRDAEGYFSNDKGGTRLATSPESTGTGEHGHRILIDDPINANMINQTSLTDLLAVNEWYDTSAISRGIDIGFTHARVLIMQRLHHLDLASHLIEIQGDAREGGDWDVLCLPERFEPSHPFVWPEDPRQDEGELLWPAQRDEKQSDALASALGPHRAAGQLQQRPAAKEGDLLKTAWWRFYDPRIRSKEEWDQLPKFSMVVMTVDCPLKDKQANDNLAIQTWGIHGTHRYLLDIRLDKMSYSGAKRAIREMAQWARRTWPRAHHRILIENTGYGTDLILDLKDEFTGLTKINPQQDGDKIVRADRASDALESGHCFLPGYGPPWKPPVYSDVQTPPEIANFILNCSRFPNAAHDDDVDAWSQMVNWMRGKQSRPVRTSSATARRRVSAAR